MSGGSRQFSRRCSTQSGSEVVGSSRGGFNMHGVDISRNHGHGTAPAPGRESHTANLDVFDRYIKIIEAADRLDKYPQPWDTTEHDEFSEGEESFDPDAEESEMTAENKPILGMNIEVKELATNIDELALSNADDLIVLSDLSLLDKKQAQKKESPDELTQYPFNAKIWAYIRSILSNAKPVGFVELADPKDTVPKGREDANNFLSKVIAIGPLNPIQPAVIAREGGFDEDGVLGMFRL